MGGDILFTGNPSLASLPLGTLVSVGGSLSAYGLESLESLDVSAGGGIDHVADLQDTGLPDASYDGVFCTQVIHHLPDQYFIAYADYF